MPRVTLTNGVLVPLDPLPAEWEDGRDLIVQEPTPEQLAAEAQAWFEEMEAAVKDMDPRDPEIIQASIDEQKRLGKEYMRRLMGLP